MFDRVFQTPNGIQTTRKFMTWMLSADDPRSSVLLQQNSPQGGGGERLPGFKGRGCPTIPSHFCIGTTLPGSVTVTAVLTQLSDGTTGNNFGSWVCLSSFTTSTSRCWKILRDVFPWKICFPPFTINPFYALLACLLMISSPGYSVRWGNLISAPVHVVLVF